MLVTVVTMSLFLKFHGLDHILINDYATGFYKSNMICFTLVLYFKLKFDLISIIYKISYICFYIIKPHEVNSFMSRSFGSCIFSTVASISVLSRLCVRSET